MAAVPEVDGDNMAAWVAPPSWISAGNSLRRFGRRPSLDATRT